MIAAGIRLKYFPFKISGKFATNFFVKQTPDQGKLKLVA